MKLRTFSAIALLLIASVSLTACQSSNWGNKQTAGTLLGAGTGAFIGNQIGSGTGNVVATAAGALLGGWLGNEIGASLDSADRAELQQAQYQAYNARTGETITWNNPDSGNYGTFTPVRDGRSSSGDYCREFQQTVTVGGKRQQAYGTACREPDGSWRMVNS